jgi:cyclopropane fatty-acyl-phospholipid synthase-like methyltransferase
MDFFDAAYQDTPPWDIGRPQKEFVELERRGEITGTVLDIGCGTGEHALFFAAEGHEVWGIDSSPLAIRKAREKAEAREIDVHFLVLDALDLTKLERKFDTATDSGLFHTLSDADRPVFADNLSAILPHGGTYFMLCFSDLEPGEYGPRRIAREEIQNSFRNGWSINYIRPAVFESRNRTEGPRAWLSLISKR